MPKPALNPALAHHRAEKARALKKSRTALAAQRAERLARRNPERLQRQIDELKEARERGGGALGARERETLSRLEREVEEVRRAREKMGVGVTEGREGGKRGEERGGKGMGEKERGGMGREREIQGGVKRRWGGDGRGNDGDKEGESGTETDEEVRRIPMPRDTPPPVPPRPRGRYVPRGGGAAGGGGDEREGNGGTKQDRAVATTTYAAAPQVRDLRAEATARFVPTAVVAARRKRGLGGRLMEPEEVDRMEEEERERAGRGGAGKGAVDGGGDGDADAARLREEEERFEREMRDVETADGYENAGVDTAGDGDVGRGLGGLGREAMRDAERAVEAAAEEAQHFMIEQEAVRGDDGDAGAGQERGYPAAFEARQAEKALRGVEVEEVEDDGS